MIFCHILHINFTLISLINAINPHRINVIAIIRDNLHSHVVAIIDKSSGRRNNTAVSGVGGNFISVNVENCRKRVIFSHISKRITISAADGIVINNQTINEITVFGSNIEGQIVAAQHKNIPIWSNVAIGGIGNRNRVFVFCKRRRHDVVFGHILQNNFIVISLINPINPDRINVIAIIRDNLQSHVVAIINQGSGRRNDTAVSVVGRNLVRINVENCRKRVIFSHISKRITISTADGIAINNQIINEITVFGSNIEGQIVAAQNKNIPIWRNIAIGGIGNRKRVFVLCKCRRHDMIFGHILQNNFIVLSMINVINPYRINEIAIIRDNLQSHIVAIIEKCSGRRNDTAVSGKSVYFVRINRKNSIDGVIVRNICENVGGISRDGITINDQIFNVITIIRRYCESRIISAQYLVNSRWSHESIHCIFCCHEILVWNKCCAYMMIFINVRQIYLAYVSLVNVVNPYRVDDVAAVGNNLHGDIVAEIHESGCTDDATAHSGIAGHGVGITFENGSKRVISSHIEKSVSAGTRNCVIINNQTNREKVTVRENRASKIMITNNLIHSGRFNRPVDGG